MSSSASGDWTWQWTWPNLDWPWTVVLIVLVGLLFARTVHRQMCPRTIGLFLLRLLALSGLVLSLWPVGWTRFEQARPTLTILLDNSRSMTWNDERPRPVPGGRPSNTRPKPVSRWQAARSILLAHDFLPSLQHDYHVVVRRLDPSWAADLDTSPPDTLAGQLRDAQADFPSTPLADRVMAIVEEHQGQGPQAILLVTDGRITRGVSLAKAADRAAPWRVPLHALGMGGDLPIRLLGIERVAMDDFALLGDRMLAQIEIASAGMAGQTVVLEARSEPDHRLLARRQVTLPGPRDLPHRSTGSADAWRSSTPVSLQIPADRIGTMSIAFSVEAADTLPSPADPSMARPHRQQVTVADPAIRVLLIASEPTYEFRALREVLARPAVPAPLGDVNPRAENIAPVRRSAMSLQCTLFSASANMNPIDPVTHSTLPAQWDRDTDAVVLCDVDPEQFPAIEQERVVKLVSDSAGGAALIAGPRFIPAAYAGQPLAALFPFTGTGLSLDPRSSASPPDPFRFKPTRIGWSLGALRIDDEVTIQRSTWSRLTPLLWSKTIPPVRPGVQVIAVASPTKETEPREGTPVATVQFIGSGCVLFHATDETWRWRFRTSDTPFTRYWQQMIRYLAREKIRTRSAVMLRTAREESTVNEPVHFQGYLGRLAPTDRDQPIRVDIHDEAGAIQSYPLHPDPLRSGWWRGEVRGLPEGQYAAHVNVGTQEATCTFQVRQPDWERSDPRPDHTALRKAARRTGGLFATSRQANELAQQLADQAVTQRLPVSFHPLLQPWGIALIVCAALASEWLLRERWQGPSPRPDLSLPPHG